MTKKILTILFLLLALSSAQAHTSMLSIGVRGGGQMYLPTAALGASGELKPAFGGTGTFDLRYTFYGCITDRFGIGFTLGGGVGYGTAGIQGNHTDTYTNFDYLGNQMDYTVSSTFRQTDRFAKGEATLMASFCFGNVILNLGPRLLIPFSESSSLTITEANIDAYYPAYNVHVINEQITGKLETPYTNDQLPITNYKYSVLIAAELGYEWYFNDRNCLGFQLYTDIGVWNSATTNPLTTNPLIQVAPITDAASPVPQVTIGSIDPLIKSRRYLDFGVRVYYAFSVSKDRGYKSHFNSRKDTRLHRNRILIF